MCRVLRASRSGFYAWVHKPMSDRAIEDRRLLGLIRASYTASGRVYGAPRVFLDLREAGERCGKNRRIFIMTVRPNSEFVLPTIVDHAQRDQLSRES